MEPKPREQKLEITVRLEELGARGELESTIAMLNLPSANYCGKRAEMVTDDYGGKHQACADCITQKVYRNSNLLDISKVEGIIDYFAKNHGTKFITVNGRGDPFDPRVRELNLGKIRYANGKGIQAYVFTAGGNLDDEVCQTLAQAKANVMISLYGNRFIDAEFFTGKEYPCAQKPLQDQAAIAKNLRKLLAAYKAHPSQPGEGITRIGMNYVLTQEDITDGYRRVAALKDAANANGIFFVCNTSFAEHPDAAVQAELQRAANEYTNFHLTHSTAVNGQCQMGAGSSVTVGEDGMLYRCPYQAPSLGSGNFFALQSDGELSGVIDNYSRDMVCVMRPQEGKVTSK